MLFSTPPIREAPGAGSSVTIGQLVIGGTPNSVVIVNGGGNLDQTTPGGANLILSWTGAAFAWIPNTTSPITIRNTTSLFSTGLAGLWTSGATNSIIFGVNAGDNADTVESLIAMGELSGANDNTATYNPEYAVFIGNRSGYNAFRAINTVGMGRLAGAYASDASYSFFAGVQAGISAQYAGNSFFFGQAAGHNATYSGYSIYMGTVAGYNADHAAFCAFLGSYAGYGAANANNATFIGARAGENDTVNNAGQITYTAGSHTFFPMGKITSSSGGVAYVIVDNGAGTMSIANSTGTFNPGDTITQEGTGYTATVSTYTPSTSSILIGDYATTGGGKNSVAIGSHSNNAGFNNSIAIGVGATNTSDNEYAWGDQIIKWRWAGTTFTLPTVPPAGGQFLGVLAGNQLYWGVPGASANSIAVLAATTTVLPFTPTYANGVSGVGATLTAGSNGALVVDGITIPLNGRVLVKDQTSQIENGVYQLSTVGDGSTAYVLTRTTDSDMASDFDDQVVIPAQGTQSATPFGQQNVVTTIGTDAIAYAAQSDIYVRQQTSGTQNQYNIPLYTSVAKTISKGTPEFSYNPITGILTLGTASSSNIFILQNGLGSLTSAAQNVVIGGLAGASLSTGSNNVIIGFEAASNISAGSNNVYIGEETGNGDTGSDNVAIGFQAKNGGFSNAVAIGSGASNTKTNQTFFANNLNQFHHNLNAYANDAAAGAAGLVTGDWYQTSGADITFAGGAVGLVAVKQ